MTRPVSRCVRRLVQPAAGYALCGWSNWHGCWCVFLVSERSEPIAQAYERFVLFLGLDVEFTVVPVPSLDDDAVELAVSALPVPKAAVFVDPAPDGVIE